MSSRQYLTDAATRHQVFLQRYGAGQSKEAVKVLNRLRRNINARLAQEPTTFQRQRLVAVLTDIESLSAEAFGTITRNTMHGANELAVSEARFSVNLFDKATNVVTGWTLPADAVLVAAVANNAMGVSINSAITPLEALEQFGKVKTKGILDTISDGVTLGDATPKISKDVGSLISTLQSRQVTSLVSTITNHTASVSDAALYAENAELLEGYQWIATLDGNTTPICGSRDLVVYTNLQSDPRPPAHWGCRSRTIPVVKPEYDLGAGGKTTRPSVGGTGAKRVSGRTSYGGWLKKQPMAFVDEALGVERSRLFRSGKLTISKFVDPTGRVYTLKELERMNPFAFLDSTVVV